jgi:PhnB protein
MTGIISYLNFDGNAREAMTFYQKCLGGDLHIMPFSDAPGGMPESAKDRVMHARLVSGPATLMASDTMPDMPLHEGNNIWLNVNCESMEEIQKVFGALGEGGKVLMPLQDQFWGAHFGMLTDQFGIHWMFNYELPKK